MAELSQFNVADVIQKLIEQEGFSADIEGIADTCNGLVITADKSLVDLLSQHRGVYNYQILDGDPFRIIRRALDDSLTIDFEIDQSECIPASENVAALKFTRIDPLSLPGEVETQYIDPDREFAQTSQYARYRSGKQTPARAGAGVASFGRSVAANTRLRQSVPMDFEITGDQARQLAVAYLYRMWSQAQSVTFVHSDLRIEGADTISLTAPAGVFILLVTENKINPSDWTNEIQAVVLLTSSNAVALAGGRAHSGIDEFAAWLLSA